LFEVWSANIEALPPEEVDRLQEKNADLQERFLSLLDDTSFAAAISYGRRPSKSTPAVLENQRHHQGDTSMIQSLLLTNFKCFELQELF